MTPHLNRLVETAQMRGENICFYAELTKLIFNYHQILPPIESSVHDVRVICTWCKAHFSETNPMKLLR